MRQKIIVSALALISLGSFIFSGGLAFNLLGRTNNVSAAFFATGISIKDLIERYVDALGERKIKILIVAGHEPNDGGAIYKNLKERDLNLELSEQIKDILSQNERFEIIMARDAHGWNPAIAHYVAKNKTAIQKWERSAKNEMARLAKNGKIKLISTDDKVPHADANQSAALFLYGINKWASENKVDIAIHVHFNDNPKYHGEPTYEGFAVYVPERQYSNGTSSKVLGQNIYGELSKIERPSTMPKESSGLVEDQDLIAIGSYNTSDSLSVLIEYAYIYEPFMQNINLREEFIRNAAQKTAKAVGTFFESRALLFSNL